MSNLFYSKLSPEGAALIALMREGKAYLKWERVSPSECHVALWAMVEQREPVKVQASVKVKPTLRTAPVLPPPVPRAVRKRKEPYFRDMSGIEDVQTTALPEWLIDAAEIYQIRAASMPQSLRQSLLSI